MKFMNGSEQISQKKLDRLMVSKASLGNQKISSNDFAHERWLSQLLFFHNHFLPNNLEPLFLAHHLGVMMEAGNIGPPAHWSSRCLGYCRNIAI